MFGNKGNTRTVVHGRLFENPEDEVPSAKGKFVVLKDDIELAQIKEEDNEETTEAIYLESGRTIIVDEMYVEAL